ncbi:MAG TPA: metallophosphoesterase [Solirubrobacteraceae bacterium]
MIRGVLPLAVALALVAAGCGGRAPDGPAAGQPGDTRSATLVDRDGDGRLEAGPGEPLVARGGRAGRTTQVLATFAQITDPHVRDEESPARVPFLDRLGAPFTSTFRPQEALSAQTLESAVEAVNALHPDGVVVTGDIADNAQRNELVWALEVLRGGVVRPDSGARGPSGPQLASDPDPFFYRPDVDAPRHPGLLARAQRAFRSPGLRTPWHAVLGNHDLLVQGELAPDQRTQAAATGDRAVVRLDLDRLRGLALPRADRFGEGGAGPIGTATVARVLASGARVRVTADPGRREVTPAEADALVRRFSGQRDLRAFDLGPHVRGIALDLVRRAGGSDGDVTAATLTGLRRELARAGERSVVVFSHQPLDRSLHGAAALDLLERDPRVVAAVAGHTHRNEIRRRGRLWLITTASLVDFPQQARAFRLVRTTTGLALETWMLDHGAGPGGLAETSRPLSFLDAQGGRPGGFAGTRADRNARLSLRTAGAPVSRRRSAGHAGG